MGRSCAGAHGGGRMCGGSWGVLGEQRRTVETREDDSANFDLDAPNSPLDTLPSASLSPPFYSPLPSTTHSDQSRRNSSGGTGLRPNLRVLKGGS